jgi:sialic acid synthase SpsE
MTTASVFDADSLDFLLRYDVPFVKLANLDYTRMYWRDVPRDIDLVVSVGNNAEFADWSERNVQGVMACISEYPADGLDYTTHFRDDFLRRGISDHTTGVDLHRVFMPEWYEKHFVTDDVPMDKPRPYCAGPEQVKQILEVVNARSNDAA